MCVFKSCMRDRFSPPQATKFDNSEQNSLCWVMQIFEWYSFQNESAYVSQTRPQAFNNLLAQRLYVDGEKNLT